MRGGHFDDACREFVITRPDTPLPWFNMLGQDEFFGLCTQTAGGYCFWKDARLRRLLLYRTGRTPVWKRIRIMAEFWQQGCRLTAKTAGACRVSCRRLRSATRAETLICQPDSPA
jgi:hypothetical protein